MIYLLGNTDFSNLKNVPLYVLALFLYLIVFLIIIVVFIGMAYIFTSSNIQKLYIKKNNKQNTLSFIPIIRWLILVESIDKGKIIGLILMLIELLKYFIIFNIGNYIDSNNTLYAIIGTWSIINSTMFLYLHFYSKHSIKVDTPPLDGEQKK